MLSPGVRGCLWRRFAGVGVRRPLSSSTAAPPPPPAASTETEPPAPPPAAQQSYQNKYVKYPGPFLTHETFYVISKSEKPLKSKQVFKALQDHLPPDSPLRNKLTISHVREAALKPLRAKSYIKPVSMDPLGQKRKKYGYGWVPAKIPKFAWTEEITEEKRFYHEKKMKVHEQNRKENAERHAKMMAGQRKIRLKRVGVTGVPLEGDAFVII